MKKLSSRDLSDHLADELQCKDCKFCKKIDSIHRCVRFPGGICNTYLEIEQQQLVCGEFKRA
jgi:hypothetical protein